MSVLTRNNIVTNGLVLYLDTLNPQSIPLDPTVNNIRSQSGSMAPTYTNPATMSASWSLADNSWYVTFETGSNSTLYKGLWCTPNNNSPFVVLEPISSRVVFSFKAQAVTGSISMSIDLNNTPYSGSSTSNDNRFQTAIFTDPFLVTTSSVSSIYATYTVQTGSANFTGSYYYTFNNIYATNGLPITQRTTVRIWDIQHELSNYQTPFTPTSRSIWYDLSGNGNHAQLVGNARPIPKYNSLNERILNFDGTGSYAVIPNNNNLVFGSGDFTVSIWIKTPLASTGEGSPSQWGPIVSKGCTTSAPAGTWWLAQNSTNNNRITFNISSTTGGTFVCSLTTNTLSDGWHNIVAMRSGSTSLLYQDGIFRTSDTTSDSNLASTSSLFIGTNDTSSTKYTSMGLSQVSLYNRALSQNEITQNYNSLKTRFNLQ